MEEVQKKEKFHHPKEMCIRDRVDGVVKFGRLGRDRKQVSVLPKA